MAKLIVEIAAASALTLAAAIAFATGAKAACPAVKVSDAFARASATPQATSGALYFSLTNQSTDRIRLVSLATDRAQTAMLHGTETVDGVAKMTHVEGLDLAPGEKLALAPGGMHVMLMGLAQPLKRGEMLDLKLGFADGCSVTAQIPVGEVAQTSAGG
jgi:hypothetical protein